MPRFIWAAAAQTMGMEEERLGMLWLVWPLDEQMRNWLDERGTRYPDKASRFPTGDEIKSALGRLHGYTVTLNDNGPNSIW